MLCPFKIINHNKPLRKSSLEEALFQVSDIPYLGHDGTIGEIAEWRLNQHLNFTNIKQQWGE